MMFTLREMFVTWLFGGCTKQQQQRQQQHHQQQQQQQKLIYTLIIITWWYNPFHPQPFQLDSAKGLAQAARHPTSIVKVGKNR